MQLTRILALFLILVSSAGLSGCRTAKNVANDQSNVIAEAVPTSEEIQGDNPAPSEANVSRPGNDPIPTDPAVKIGLLANGLTYYIRTNKKPTDRAELRLAVNAGSILESDSQLGLAHFVEHMAFNGTERFQKQELIEYLESTGVEFGADLNAYTSFDETVYMLQVPTDSLELLDTGIQIMREWASRILFDDEEVDKERGVVIEEWRLGRGADSRIRDKELPVMLQGSRYPDRLPIGTLENLQSFDAQLLKDFYRDWYRPDLMAVIVVGDFDADHVEQLIRSEFSSFEAPADVRPRNSFLVPDHDETLVSIVADPEAPVKSIGVMYKADDPHANEAIHTLEMFREQFVEGLYTSLLNDRLNELTQNEEPPFFGAGSGFGTFARSKKLYNISTIPGEKGYAAALEAVLIEVERIKRYGFEPSELDRAKVDLLRWYERAYAERDKSESRGYASEYVNNFLEREPIPGIAFEYDSAKELLPGITLEEVNDVAARTMTDKNRVLLASGPEIEDEPLPSADDLLQLFASVKDLELSRYVDAVEEGELMEDIPVAGAIVGESHEPVSDVHHLKLSNGVEVYYKQTNFKNDQILMTAFSPGGTSLIPEEQDVPGDFATTLVVQGGLGRFGPIELQKKLSGKVVQVSPGIGERRETVSGMSSPTDVEALFQLTHLYFTAPRTDSVAYASLVTRYRSVLENMSADPQRAFFDTLSTTLTQNHPRRRPLAVSTLDEMDLQQSVKIYRDRFADASDFTFFFVGSFDEQVLRSMVETYLASLPSLNRVEEPVNLGIRPPSGHVEKTINRGTEPKSRVQIVWTGEAKFSERERRTMKLIEGVLDIQLREVLREDLGGTYGVSVTGGITSEPEERFQMSLAFGAGPERIDELITSAMSELDRFQKDGPDQDDLDKVIEKISRSHEVGLKQNEYWIASIQYLVDKGLPLDEIMSGGDSFYHSVTTEDLRKASQLYLDRTNLVKVILNPAE